MVLENMWPSSFTGPVYCKVCSKGLETLPNQSILQVIISGQVTVASRINQHLEVKLLTHKVKDAASGKDSTSILGPFQTLPSYVIEQSNVRAVKVRLMGQETPWSQEISVLPNKTTDTRLVKV